MAAPNVVVIGGGIIGASIAWHMAPDANVTIVAEKLGGVATPFSFAWINAETSTQEYYDFRMTSINHWKDIHRQLPNLDMNFEGGLTFSMPPDELQDYLEQQTERGYDIVRVERSEMNKLETNLVDDALPDWAVLARDEGHMEAELVALDLITDSKRYGTTVVEQSVLGFLKNDAGHVTGVKTSHGVIEADHVVLAAGLGCIDILATENITIPLEPREGLLVNSLPTKAGQLKTLYNGDVLHMRQTSYGVIRSAREFSGGDPGNDPDTHAEEVFAQVKAAFKNGDELLYGGYTIGSRPQPSDGYPLLGRTGVDGLTLAVMHSGVTNGALVGKVISELVLTNVTNPLMSPYTLDRF